MSSHVTRRPFARAGATAWLVATLFGSPSYTQGAISVTKGPEERSSNSFLAMSASRYASASDEVEIRRRGLRLEWDGTVFLTVSWQAKAPAPQKASPCASTWDRRFRLSTRLSAIVPPNRLSTRARCAGPVHWNRGYSWCLCRGPPSGPGLCCRVKPLAYQPHQAGGILHRKS